MSIRILALAAVASLVAVSANAQSVSGADVQLALTAGVEPGAYSTNQLSRLIEAESEGRTGQVNFILNQAKDGPTYFSTSSTPSNPTPTFGTGVNAGNY